MALRVSERVQALVFVAVLVSAIAGLYAVAQQTQPRSVPRADARLVSLEIEGVGWSIHYRPPVTVNNTAFGVLREASAALDFSLTYQAYEVPQGVFVTEINGSANGVGGRYWQYWVNGTYESVAADHRVLRGGETVLWRFSIPQEGG